MTARGYTSPVAFKQALEQRLRSGSRDGIEFARRRQRLVFARCLAPERVPQSASGMPQSG